MEQGNAISTKEHWQRLWTGAPKRRLPSSLNVGTRDLKALLLRHIRPETRVLEVGCAPGKILAWVAHELRANVSGIDYADRGIQQSRQLFTSLGIAGDLRCEDAFASSFPRDSFDCVYSVGLIEHFKDPSDLVRKHVELLKPGGKALILVPNYAGFYGSLQRYFDGPNLDIHNLGVMSEAALVALLPLDLVCEYRAYRWGMLNPWMVSWANKWPKALAFAWCLSLNALGLIQLVRLNRLAPWIVLEATRNRA